MNIYQWLCLFSVPTLIFAIIKYITHQINSVRKGVQALLRAQMISDYNKYFELGYAPIYARENFENCWKYYHKMGMNGVMDDIHVRFLQLPTEKPDEEREN